MGIGVLFWLCIEAGRIALRGPHLRPREEIGLQFHLGLALIAPVLLFVGCRSLVVVQLFVLLPGSLVALYAMFRIMESAAATRTASVSRRQPLTGLERTSLAVTLLVCLSALAASMAPVTSWDATTAHLAVPQTYARLDRIQLIPGNVYSAYPQLMQTLFALGANDAGGTSAPIASWLLCVLAAVSVYGLGHRLGGRTAGLVAAATFSSAPIFIAQAGTVAIDVPFTGFLASALLALLMWSETASRRHLVIAGVIAGAACGIRHTGYLAAFLMLAWVALEGKQHRAKSAFVFAAAAFAASAPWWMHSWILVGNPVYPLLTSVFGDGGMPDVQVTGLLQHETARSAGLVDLLTFPWRIVMQPERFDGWQASPGGLVVALGVVGVLTRGRMARWLGGFSLAGILTIYYVQRFARYLFPFFMPLHVTGALFAVRPGPLRRPIAGLLVFSYIYGLGLALGTTYYKWPVVLGLESCEHYLAGRVERYPAFQWLNAHTPEDATVLTLDPRSYFIHRNSFQNLAAIAQLKDKSIDAQWEWMKEHEIRYIFIPDAYVASSPIFRERGITPLIDAWRADARFHTVYSEDLPDPRSGGTEHVTILEVARGDDSGSA